MRVVLITSKLNFVTAGGSVADLHLKARGLVERGHEVTVVTAFSQANKINQELPYRVAEEYIRSGHLLAIQRGIYRIFKKYESQADVFYIDGHIFLYGGGVYRWLGGGKPIAAFFNIRLNCWGDTQGNTVNPPMAKRVKKKLRYILERFVGVPIANHLDTFIFNTPQVEKMYVEWGFKKNKSNVIEDFVDTEVIRSLGRTEIEIEVHQKNIDPVIFFTSGRMIKEKGFDLVINAFARLSHKDKAKLIMSGGGPEYGHLVQLTKDLGLEKQVLLPGWVEKDVLHNFFQTAHVFIFPKWWIEYGSAILTEAMAYGLPSIVPAGGALEWLSVGGSLPSAPDSVEALTAHMERLIEDTPLRISLAKGSLERIITRLDWNLLSQKLEKVLRSITPV